MSEGRSEGTAVAGNRPGRHRRSAAAGTWTPAVEPAGHAGRHRAPGADTPPAAERVGRQVAVISGELPLPEEPPTAPTPAVPAQRLANTAQRPAQARIPVALAGPTAERPVTRTKVTLGAPPEPVEEARVYIAPPLDGLSSFDLGSVPASVTPPRSWRKAAWFATVSSGGVAVALLLAGSLLVGQQPTTNDATSGWAGFPDRPPAWHDEGLAAPERERADRTTATSDDDVPKIHDAAGVRPSGTQDSDGGSGSGSAPGGSSTVTVTPTGAPTTSEPEKPPTRPAERETRSDAVYRFPPNAQTMGDRSEIFLNEITENPERAHEQTGGELYAEGAESIAKRYAHIAYFEVTHIYIDQKNRETINTVEIYYTDGSHETGQRTLKFHGDDDKITDD